jgi:hypothetical protein
MFLRPLPLVLVLFFAEVLLPLAHSATIASDPVPATKTPAARESAIVNRVLIHSLDRQERIKSFHVTWESPAHRRAELWMDGDARYCVVVSPKPNRTAWLHSFDGVTSRTCDGRSQQGTISEGDQGIESGVSVFPILLYARAISQGKLNEFSKRWHVISENAIIGNKHCVKLQMPKGDLTDNFWVDPGREDLILGWERLRNGRLSEFVSIDYRNDKEHGWVPTGWTTTDHSNRANRPIVDTIASFTINDAYPKEAFAPAFPPGTAVLDRKLLESYVVADDGSKLNVVKYDSPDTLRIHEALDQTVDFQIDMQPLKDALEFIAQRYQIKVTFDAQAVHDKLIDPRIDVKLPVTGIKLRSCLNLLLEQSRKPLAYEIRNGALVIVPAARAK